MGNSSEVRLILNAIDNASHVIGGVKDSVSGMNAVMGAGQDFAAGLGINLNALSNPAMFAGQMVKKLADYIGDATQETVAYAEQTRDLSRLLGTTAEETSTLIQVADDFKVSYETLKMAARNLSKEGLSPNIETLQKLSAEYQAIQDPAQRTAFLMDKFGRAGLEMGKIMEATADQIADSANAAKAQGLVLSGPALKAARDYEIAMDNMQDAQKGLNYTVGQQTIPLLVEMTNKVNTSISGWTLMFTTMKDMNSGAIVPLTASYKDYKKAFDDAQAAMGNFLPDVNAMSEAEYNALKTSEDLDFATRHLGQVFETTTTSVAQNTAVYSPFIAEMLRVTETTKGQGETVEELEKRLGKLNDLISGSLGPEVTDFNTKQANLRDRMQEVLDKIDLLEGQSYLTPAQKTELENLKTEYGNLSTEYGNNATAHEEATKRIILDLLIQQAAMDGLSSGEVAIITNIATKWGLIDTATAEATAAISQSLSDLANGKPMADVMADIEKILRLTAAGDKVFNYTFHSEMTGDWPSGEGEGAGQGQGTCFLAGTMITMADGKTKVIENIQPDEMVLGWDEITMETSPCQVSAIIQSQSCTYRLIVLSNGGHIAVTHTHPFYVYGWGEFVEAGKLHVGDVLVTPDGRNLAIVELYNIIQAQPRQVYNLTVDGCHTFVAQGVIVHNKEIDGGTVGGGTTGGTGGGTGDSGGGHPGQDNPFSGKGARSGGFVMNNTFYVNGTAQDVANQIVVILDQRYRAAQAAGLSYAGQ